MKTEYLELLFQHKFATQKSIENMRTIDVFPADTNDCDVHNAKLKMYELELENIQHLINAYIMYHTENH